MPAPFRALVGVTTMIALTFMFAGAAWAKGEEPYLDGSVLTVAWGVPFAGILLSIALFPLIAPQFWHHHFGKVSLFWGLAFLLPFTIEFGVDLALFELLDVGLLEYMPFIILLFALFTVAGGVRVTGSLAGTPVVNTAILLLGTAIASLMGTTGAAMLLIRPILGANQSRKHRVHTIVFFIFLVANVGGSLTPLGDPPLFLGFLKGVSFFWPTVYMLAPMAMVSGILLVVYFLLDSYFFTKENHSSIAINSDESGEKLGIEGGVNILLLGGVIGAVLMSGIWKPDVSVEIFYVELELQNIARDLLLLVIAGLSLKLTNDDSRIKNGFSWFPILEVAKLFAGIFITIIPAIAMLKAGQNGALASVVNSVTSPEGAPVNIMYFWATGVLSSFLDNAPTYLVFFNTAGGSSAVDQLMNEQSTTLLAISAGAVFMGANTYIGNAPNFMVKAIAEESGVAMPSFFGYMAWSIVFLLPLFALVSYVFFL